MLWRDCNECMVLGPDLAGVSSFRSPLDRLSGRDVSAQKGSVVTLRTDHYPADRRGPKQCVPQDPLVRKRKYRSLEAQAVAREILLSGVIPSGARAGIM